MIKTLYFTILGNIKRLFIDPFLRISRQELRRMDSKFRQQNQIGFDADVRRVLDEGGGQLHLRFRKIEHQQDCQRFNQCNDNRRIVDRKGKQFLPKRHIIVAAQFSRRQRNLLF